MPLTTCSDCGREISTQAPSCPGCGRPGAAPVQPKPRFIGWQVAGGGAMVVGVGLASVLERYPENEFAAAGLIGGGLLVLLAARVASWFGG